MRLCFGDTVSFLTKEGTSKAGAAIRYDVRSQQVWVKVLGPQFFWEGGPPGESLNAKGELLPGQIGHLDAIYLVPVGSIQEVTPGPRKPVFRKGKRVA